MLPEGREAFEGATGVKNRAGSMQRSESGEEVSLGMGPGEFQPPGREHGRAETGMG